MSELTVIIVSIFLIAMVCLPLIINHYKQKNKANLLKERLKSEAQVSHLNTSDFETWRETYCIGLDQHNSQLLFLNILEKDVQVHKFDLGKVRLCRPIRNFREIKEGKVKRQIINKISLVLDQFDEHMKPFEVELYDEEKNDYIINEWELAQTWSKRINDLKN
ncbi:hypothetical protein [Algoriphagus chordae]|uniref:Uncharacterized protein n=1 Tax=Algoriphagus chordae TaxID=237019 RepID=A0A2W7R6R9_9BACT|nr:hypothetical protein [Algoriphagus chordae]PZX56568.1 hypothetical protein LV85_00495 [Algoriphagus chordae]